MSEKKDKRYDLFLKKKKSVSTSLFLIEDNSI